MITELQYNNMLRAANGSGWINFVLKTKTKEQIMEFVPDYMYFDQTIKKMAMLVYLSRKTDNSIRALMLMNEEELFSIIETHKLHD